MSQNIYDAVIAALQEKKLDFTAEMRRLSYVTADGTMKETGMFSPVRTDNDTLISNHSFTSAYHIIQNRDALKVVADIGNISDAEFRDVGSWGNGAGVYAQIALGDDIVVGNNDDRVGRYLSIVNSHDGTRGCTILITPYRFWCKNQIAPAIRHAAGIDIFRIRHNSLAESRLKILRETIRVCDDVFVNSKELYCRMADRVIDMDFVREAISRAHPLKLIEDTVDQPTVHYSNRLHGMLNRFEISDGGLTEKMTAWNLYNSIQGTFQHDARESAMKNFSVICGPIARQSQRALGIISDMMDGYTKTSTPEFDTIFAREAA